MPSNDTTANPPQHVGSTAELGGTAISYLLAQICIAQALTEAYSVAIKSIGASPNTEIQRR